MTALQSLRQSTRLALLALVWFGLTLAAAVAAPMVRPVPSVLICSAAGHYLQPLDADDTAAGPSRLHCPLCLSHAGSAPPPAAPAAALPALAQTPPRLDAGVQLGADTVAPPARAPPGFPLSA